MNQNEQMREALRLANKSLKRWMPISWDRQAMDEYHQAISASEQALATEPATLVRLTDDSLISIYLTCKAEWKATNKRERERIAVLFGHAIMDAIIAKNGGK